MNRWIVILVIFALGMSPGLGQDRSPTTRLVTSLKPGMTWKVESLPEGQNILASRVDAPAGQKAAERPSATVVEENVMGNGFRLQKKILNSGGLQTFLFQEDKYFIMLPDEVSYSIEFPDPEIPSGVVDSKRLREFDWVGTEWLTGTRLVDGVECDIYCRPWPPGVTAEGAAQPGKVAEVECVAIARGDRFPRRWESPGRTYRYVPLPRVSPPDLPPGAVAAARELQERLDRQANRYRIPQ